MTKVTEKQRKQSLVLQALIESPTLDIAASRSGVTTRTIYNYLSDEAFSASLMDYQQFALRETSRRLVAMSGSALDVLTEVIRDPEVAAGIRARSAEKVIYASLRFSEAVDLLHKLRKVEKRLGNDEYSSDPT